MSDILPTDRFDFAVLNLINKERTDRGLQALTLSQKLDTAADRHSKDMAVQNYFSHTGKDGSNVGVRIERAGYTRWNAWGENIAAGQRSAESVVQGWMNSPGHRANILSANFTHMGLGYVTNASGRPYWTQVFAAGDPNPGQYVQQRSTPPQPTSPPPNSPTPPTATSGADTLAGSAQNDTIRGLAGNDRIVGAGGGDTLYGDSGSDYLNGQAGNDTVMGGAGNDTLLGDADNDALLGGLDNDKLYGGIGHDYLNGQSGNDSVFGGTGNDRLIGNGGNDYLNAQLGNDTVIGGAGRDVLLGSSGADLLYGNADKDFLYGQAGNDVAIGGTGNDVLHGGNGNDLLVGQLGLDTLVGGAGRDWFKLARLQGRDWIHDFENGLDRIQLSGGLTFSGIRLRQSGSHVSIFDTAGYQVAIVANTSLSELSSADFV